MPPHGNRVLHDGEYRIAANGIVHWCRVAGARHQSMPLVIIHGGPGGNNYAFERTIGPRLEQLTTVIYYEQRGCGRSEAPAEPEAYSLPLLVADLEALRQAWRQERIIPLGYSFGGEVALEYALAHPDRVSKLIVQAPGVGDADQIAYVQLAGFT
ncbi:MAG TPA: alpha/beta fold hydrolase, partial [Chloroflexota bacterium]|nr:alpha/beta fold hydrolase [Chloroflexota bacterium]